MNRIDRLRQAASGYLFPGRCASCGDPLLGYPSRSWPLCPPCEEKLDFAPESRCSICGRELISEIGTCMDCRTRSYRFESNHPLYPYSGPYRDLVVRYKFGGFIGLGRFFAEQLSLAYRERYEGLPVVPVPFRREKMKKTGWDQIDLIAREMRRSHGVPVVFGLERGKSLSQKTLNYEDRLKNLKGKIRVRPGACFPGTDLVLLDDVFTTGATLSECARVLKEAGAARVCALTIAID
jgi:competence protein ComFC